MGEHTFILNGKRVTVEVEDDVRLLWVLRDILGVTGPKYGCGIAVCQACTSHRNGAAFQPCSIPVSALADGDRITTIEGLPATVKKDLHPMQQAWLDHDVSQCGYCQPGQIMAAVALVHRAARKKRPITDADLDRLRNVCRCGTYPRIREAIEQGAAGMAAIERRAKLRARRRKKLKARRRSPRRRHRTVKTS
jgi:isoquinoline 1-oxidoreductase alpha subunit